MGWRWEPRGREVSEVEELRRVLEGHSPKRGGLDRVVWNLEPQSGYSVKLMKSLLEEKRPSRGVSGNDDETKWLKSIPGKVCIFI